MAGDTATGIAGIMHFMQRPNLAADGIFNESSCHNELDGGIAVNRQTADKWLIAARSETFNTGKKIVVDVI